MDIDIDPIDDNVTMLRKRIGSLQREVRATGDLDAREQLVAAYRNLGIVLSHMLACQSLCDEQAIARVGAN